VVLVRPEKGKKWSLDGSLGEMTVYKLEAGIRFLTETYGKCLSPLERRERDQKEKLTPFTLILRSIVLVFRCRDMCCVCKNKEISRIYNAAWKK
jgi:hypothetical protein